jgi:aryl-alcohol dehydrogenase-like predicted oxidoreductase
MGLAGRFSIPGMRPSLAAGRDMPYRMLGRTGEKLWLIGVGGAHIGKQEDENESIRIIRTAIDRGINFMDNSWDYNDGQSEIRMGKAQRDCIGTKSS